MFRFIAPFLVVTFLAWPCAEAASIESPNDRDKAWERLEILRMWKMMEALNLDKATADKIFEIRAKFVGEQKQLRRELQADIRKLRDQLKESATASNDRELETLLKNVRDKRKRLQALWNEQYDEVSKILSIRQQAELVLFLKDFHREIRALLYPLGAAPQAPGEPRGKEGQSVRPPAPPRVPAAPENFSGGR